jgi:molybdate transport system substrate-binding protein
LEVHEITGTGMRPIKLAFAALAAAFFLFVPAQAADITVFAAASLTEVLQGIGKSYEAKTHNHVVFSFAASSTLANQIEGSSGADIFMSADTDWMDYLDSKGLIDHPTRKNLLGNSLVLVAPADSNVTINVADHFPLLAALRGGRLSIADPDSVPAGKYGRTALIALGVWSSVQDHIVSAENVRAALAYVARKEAPLGIVYKTDAMAEPKVRIAGTFPENSHHPIVYPAALTSDAKPEAKNFFGYLSGAKAKAIFEKAGFTVLK